MSYTNELEYRVDYGEGWYELENDGLTDFRWMKRDAVCFVSGPDVSFPGVLKITAGHPFENETNPILSVESPRKLNRKVEISWGEKCYYVPVGVIEDKLRIGFKISKTFESSVTNDARTLGILVKKIELLNLHEERYLYADGWYDEECDSELPFRWTDQNATILLSPDLLKNISFLQFCVISPYPNFSQILKVSMDGQSLVELPLVEKWTPHIVCLSDYMKKRGLNRNNPKDCVELVFSVDKTFDDELHPLDPRKLGIKIRDVEFHSNEKEYKIYSAFQGNSQLDSIPRFFRNTDFEKLKSYNYYKNLCEFKEAKTILTSFPVSIYVDVNLKCNLSCPSCFRSDPRYKSRVWPTMGYTLFKKIAQELFPTAYKVTLSGGGESILNRDFDKMIELCSYYHVRPILYTNATTLNRQRITLLARSGTVLGISIDGAAEMTFEKLRYPAKWRTIIKSLDTIKAIREEIDNDEFYPYFGVVIQRDNMNELATFVELAEHYRFDLIKFNRLDPYYPELEKKIPDPEEVDRELAKALESATKKGIRLYVPDYGDTSINERIRILKKKNVSFPIKMDKNNPDSLVKYPSLNSKNCQIPWSETLITPEGKVSVGCCSEFELGDINVNDFSEIWNNKIYRRLRSTVNSKKPMSFCRHDICYFRR